MDDNDSGYYTANDAASSRSSGSSRSSSRRSSQVSSHSSVSTQIRRSSEAPARISTASSHSSKRPSSRSASIHEVKSRSSSSSASRKSHSSSDIEVGTAQQGAIAAAHPVYIGGSGSAPEEQHINYPEEHNPSVHVRSSPDFSSSSSSSNRNPSVSSFTSYTDPQPAYQLKAYSKIPRSIPISYKQEGGKYYEHRHHTLRSTSIESIFQASEVYSRAKKVRRFRPKKAGPQAYMSGA